MLVQSYACKFFLSLGFFFSFYIFFSFSFLWMHCGWLAASCLCSQAFSTWNLRPCVSYQLVVSIISRHTLWAEKAPQWRRIMFPSLLIRVVLWIKDTHCCLLFKCRASRLPQDKQKKKNLPFITAPSPPSLLHMWARWRLRAFKSDAR